MRQGPSHMSLHWSCVYILPTYSSDSNLETILVKRHLKDLGSWSGFWFTAIIINGELRCTVHVVAGSHLRPLAGSSDTGQEPLDVWLFLDGYRSFLCTLLWRLPKVLPVCRHSCWIGYIQAQSRIGPLIANLRWYRSIVSMRGRSIEGYSQRPMKARNACSCDPERKGWYRPSQVALENVHIIIYISFW